MENILLATLIALQGLFVPLGADKASAPTMENTSGFMKVFFGIDVADRQSQLSSTREDNGQLFHICPISQMPDFVGSEQNASIGRHKLNPRHPGDAPAYIAKAQVEPSLARSPDRGSNPPAFEVTALPDGLGSQVGSVRGEDDAQTSQDADEQRHSDPDRGQQELRTTKIVRNEPLVGRLPLGAQIALVMVLGGLAFWPLLAGLVLVGLGWADRRIGWGLALIGLSEASFLGLLLFAYGST